MHEHKAVRKQVLDTLSQLAGDPHQQKISVASICTGWGMGEMVDDAINEYMQDIYDDDAPQAQIIGN
jgi:hypothetical protein